MIYILLLSSILYAYSLSPENPRITQDKKCVNCKFFLLKENNPFNWNLDNNPDYGKCSLFPKHEQQKKYVVAGEEVINNADFSYCTTARSFADMCGKDARFYRHKYKPRKNKLSRKMRCFNKIRKLFNDYLEDAENENVF